ncbi:MAG: hypothetical protein AAF493_00015 [Pseudomonadota bacterium]
MALWSVYGWRYDSEGGCTLPIVNSQSPALLPDALNDELHIRADKRPVIYRRWLGALGFHAPASP